MCLAIPGRVTAIDHDTIPLTGTVDFAGVQRDVCLDWVPEVRTGQYVIVHVGFAIAVVDEAEAERTIALAREMEESARKEGRA